MPQRILLSSLKCLEKKASIDDIFVKMIAKWCHISGLIVRALLILVIWKFQGVMIASCVAIPEVWGCDIVRLSSQFCDVKIEVINCFSR